MNMNQHAEKPIELKYNEQVNKIVKIIKQIEMNNKVKTVRLIRSL